MHILLKSLCVTTVYNGSAAGDNKRERHDTVYVENSDFVLVNYKTRRCGEHKWIVYGKMM